MSIPENITIHPLGATPALNYTSFRLSALDASSLLYRGHGNLYEHGILLNLAEWAELHAGVVPIPAKPADPTRPENPSGGALGGTCAVFNTLLNQYISFCESKGTLYAAIRLAMDGPAHTAFMRAHPRGYPSCTLPQLMEFLRNTYSTLRANDFSIIESNLARPITSASTFEEASVAMSHNFERLRIAGQERPEQLKVLTLTKATNGTPSSKLL